MPKENVELKICKDWIIPEELIDHHASMQAQSKNELGLTGVPKEFFIRRLKHLHNIPVPDNTGAFNIMPFIDGKIVGWGHLSWSSNGKDWGGGELFVYVVPEERGKGLGTRMCRELLQKIPQHADVLTVRAPKEGPGSSFAQEKLGATLVKEERKLLSKIQQFNLEEIRQKAERYRQIAEERGFEIKFVSGKTLEQDIDFQAFVKLVEQIESKNLNKKWTKEEIARKMEEYKKILDRIHEREAQFWNYLVIEKKTGKLVGYTQSLLNFENSSLLAIDNKTGVLDGYNKSELALSLKYQVLERLLRNTKVTHWTSFAQDQNKEDYMIKIDTKLGFEYDGTQHEYDLTKENWERFHSKK
ncbi:MAG: GNAT family N-acetyltransferase [Candidatus Hodarchaeota archaeon]